jgi:deoxyribodipyrimidine photolyase-related protein
LSGRGVIFPRVWRVRNLVLVLGDQLNRNSAAFDGFDKRKDAVLMAEVREESTHVWSHKVRIALFLSAMRHFRDSLRAEGIRVEYFTLDQGIHSLQDAVKQIPADRVIAVQPGDYRVAQQLSLQYLPDRHFLCTPQEFASHAKGRKQLRMEFFYREMRRQHRVLMDGDDPVGGEWNYDSENRGSFGAKGPGLLPRPVDFAPDNVTREVTADVERFLPNHPGSLAHFNWPVTPEQAQAALDDFIANRLPYFGEFQDAMWTAEPFLYHSRISAALNLKLLAPRAAIEAAERAYRQGAAPLAAVEGFIRQILGWREYVRGIYWHFMPEYAGRNALQADQKLPSFYWTGDTDMTCLREAIGQTLQYGYAHHIQRLMVTGLFALLYSVEPRQIHEWYLAAYVDAVEWVELPNTIGMSQFADGGVMASKPYVASGKYIDRMSNYCKSCRFNPADSTGDTACPFTTLYWDFLARHEKQLAGNARMQMQLKNLARLDSAKRRAISQQANQLRETLA